MPRRRPAPHVHKFGGASLEDGGAVGHAVSLVRERSERGAVVVVSALAGVTNALLDVAARAGRGDESTVRTTTDALARRYADIALTLLPAGARRRELVAEIETSFAEVATLARGLAILREVTARTSDYVVARGEQLSARLFAAALEARGTAAAYVDAREVIRTDGAFGGASPDLALTDQRARAVLAPLLARGVVPVVPGFLGAAPSGEVVTLGRGGSDLTATLLGRALSAAEVSLWKDVPGLLTADPRIVPDARVVPQLNVREAAELAYYGATVLHPRALIPVVGRRVPLFVRPFADPAARGTEISGRRTLARYPVKALSAVRAQALVTVAGNGMLGVPGIAARTFAALHREAISVSLISQASSEHSICFTVPEAAAERARASLAETFRDEIARREIDGVEVRPGVATLAVVGLGMAGAPGAAARVFASLARDVNVIAVAQGSSELNISVVVDSGDAAAALRLIHAAFQLSKIGGGSVATRERADVVILGFGQIGRVLARLIARARQEPVALRIVAVADRSGVVFDPSGLAPRRLARLAAGKRAGVSLADAPGGRPASALEAVELVSRHALSRPLLVDATAEETSGALAAALGAGMDLVLANKRPLTTRKEEADALAALARTRGRRILHETTVGAGLPIIDTFHRLVESGDRVYRIEGCTSGTLGYLLDEVGRGRRFSEALRSAMAKGYTEPDPRDDLSGMDVARKALILGRLLGFPGELADVEVESLVPAHVARLPLADFLARLEELDAGWERRVRAARERGGVIRYVARVTRRRISAGAVVVDGESPFASLRGTDNQLAFTTARYKTNPLVVTGPGAGAAVTAAGVLNDMLRIVGT